MKKIKHKKYTKHKKYIKHRKNRKAGTQKFNREKVLSLITIEKNIPVEVRKIILKNDRQNELASKLSRVWHKYKIIDSNLHYLLKKYIGMINNPDFTQVQKNYVRDYIVKDVLPNADDYDDPYWMLDVTPQSKDEIQWSIDEILSDTDNSGEGITKTRKTKKMRKTKRRGS